MSDTLKTPEDQLAARQNERAEKAQSLKRFNTSSRKAVRAAIGLGCVVAIGASALSYFARSPEAPQSRAARPPKLQNNAGGTNVTPQIQRDYHSQDKSEAQRAADANKSYTPGLAGASLAPPDRDPEIADPNALPRRGGEDGAPAPPPPPPPPITDRAPLGKGGRGDAPPPPPGGGMTSRPAGTPALSPATVTAIFDAWNGHGAAIEMAKDERNDAGAGLAAGPQGGSLPPVTSARDDLHMADVGARPVASSAGDANAAAGRTLLAAGRGIYATTVTAANSDQPGPVIADVASGPFTGARLIGSFQRADERLVIKFNQLVIGDAAPPSVDAVAVAPDTMETAVASGVNEHWVTRIVLPTGAAFVQGLGQALQTTNTQSYTAGLGLSSFTHLTLPQQLGVAAGAAGQNLSQLLQKATPQQPTVTLAANLGIGVLFLKPVVEK